jgi:SulP family sulfate permease
LAGFRGGLRLILPFLGWLPGLTARELRADVIAGLTGAAIVLPQAVAFSAVAGMPPEYGLYTAMVAPVVAALFGSSRVMVTGPNTPLAIVIFTTVAPLAAAGSPEYVGLVLKLTVLVGLLQIAAGLARLGSLVGFVSPSVMVGFTAAAGIVIAVSQTGTALGLPAGEGGASVLRQLAALVSGIGAANPVAAGIAAVTLVSVLLIQRLAPRLPGFLIALGIGAAAGWLAGAEAKGVAMVGVLPAAFPAFTVPDFRAAELSGLAQGALALALIALLQALTIGRTLAVRRKERFSATREIWGQGLANLVGGFFQNYVSSGSFTRSAVNAEAGARTPLAAVAASLILVGLVWLLMPYFAHVPQPAIAALILYVAWRLIDRAEIRRLLATSRSETAVLAATFATGLLVELDFAVFIGVIASLVAFLRRSSQPVLGVLAPKLVNGVRKFVSARDNHLPECPQITVMRLDGALYFGSAEHVERAFRRIERESPQQRIRVLIMKGVGDIDLTGADLLIEEVRAARARGGDIHLIVQEPLAGRLAALGVAEEFGPGHLHAGKAEAVEAAVGRADNEICRSCRVRLFHECSRKPGARAAMRELGY